MRLSASLVLGMALLLFLYRYGVPGAVQTTTVPP